MVCNIDATQPLTSQQEHDIKLLMYIVCWLSLFGSLFVVVTFVVQKRHLRFPQNLLLWFAVSGLLLAVFLCISTLVSSEILIGKDEGESALCIFQGNPLYCCCVAVH